MNIKRLLFLLVFSYSSHLMAQMEVKGIITDVDNSPLIGANISIQSDPGSGTITDFDGMYTISVPDGDAVLIVSYTGYQSKVVPVEGRSEINIVLEEGVELDEVVVTALGLSREKKAITYSAQNVGVEELSQARSLNVTSSLSGKVAGLSVTTSGEGVGGANKVLLRGNRSISGSSQPLYIVDGIILNGDIRNISPDDIEDVTVLKGANAAALYGSRASNGAIVVTTKSGKGAPNGVSSSANITFQASDPIHLLKFQNEYGQGSAGTYAPAALTSWGPRMDGQQVDHWSNDPNYLQGTTYSFSPQPDNVTDYFQTGYEMATNLSTTINNNNTSTFLSYTYTDARGTVPGNDLNSHNLNARVNADLFDNLSMDSKVNYIRQDFENILYGGENYDNPMRYLYFMPRNIRTEDIEHYQFFNESGQNKQHYWSPRINGGGNPYWTRNNVLRPTLRERMIGMVSLKYNITEDLSILGRSALDRTGNYQELKRFNDTYTRANDGSYEKIFNYSYEWNSDFLLNYDKDLTSNFSIDLNVGGNLRKFKRDYLNGAGDIFQVENLFSLANTADPRPSEGSSSVGFAEKEVQSLYAFGQFGFFNALYLDLSARNDWSSTLPADNRSYFYPSFGLTAVLSDLITMPNFITFLKLRGSWAEVGNDTDPYRLARQAIVRRGTVLLDSKLPAENLRPETTQSLEFGIDARFFDNNLRLDATYYKSNTFDQLFETPIPPASGAQSIFQNGADIQNKGVEILVGVTPVSTDEFTWDLNFNFGKNESTVLEIAEGFDVLNLGGADFIRQYQLEVGKPFGNVVVRGFQKNDDGEVIVGADGLPLITPGLDYIASNFNPDWLGGISNNFSYKNFNLSFLVDIRQGGSVVSFTEAILAGNGVLDYTLTGRDGNMVFGEDIFSQYTAVTESGEPNNIQISSEDFWNSVGGRNTPVGEPFVRDASNVRLREVVLGYSFPSNKIHISLVGRNLFFISNAAEYFDPEILTGTGNSDEGREAFALPTNRTYGISVKLDF